MSQEALLARLEAAVARLESLGSGAAPQKKKGDEMDDATTSGLLALTEFETFRDQKVSAFLKAFEPYADLQEHKAKFEAAWANQYKLIKASALCKKPTDQELLAFLQPEVQCIERCQKTDFKSAQKDHQTALSEAAPAFSWPFSKPTFAHVEGMRDAAAMYLNRILTASKEADEKTKNDARAFNTAIRDTFTAYAAYLKEHFKMGLEWNPQGKSFTEWASGAASAPAPKPAAAATATVATAAAPAAVPEKQNLFGSLNQGSGVTTGLKKVTDDMKTKNQKDLPPAQPIVPKAPAKKEEPKPLKPASITKQGPSHYVEWQWNVPEVKVDIQSIVEGVYIGNGRSSNVYISGKVKSVTIDKCFRVNIFVEDFLSSIEIVNSESCTVYVTKDGGNTYAIDKSKGCIINFSEAALKKNPDIVTSCISECNCQTMVNDELVEMAIPEQYTHKIVPNKGKGLPYYVSAEAVAHM